MRSADGLAGGQHQDRHAIAEHPHAPGHLEAVDAGQPHVEHDRVRHRARDLLERLLAVGGRGDVVARERERAAQRVAHRSVIVDDQDPHRRDCYVARRASAAARPLQS